MPMLSPGVHLQDISYPKLPFTANCGLPEEPAVGWVEMHHYAYIDFESDPYDADYEKMHMDITATDYNPELRVIETASHDNTFGAHFNSWDGAIPEYSLERLRVTIEIMTDNSWLNGLSCMLTVDLGNGQEVISMPTDHPSATTDRFGAIFIPGDDLDVGDTAVFYYDFSHTISNSHSQVPRLVRLRLHNEYNTLHIRIEGKGGTINVRN